MTWATSLAQAARERLPGLRLRGSTDLICNNMMCEKVGETCLCKLSMVLQRMHHLRHLDLRDNNLDRLPEVWMLPSLETLDVRDNKIGAFFCDLQRTLHQKTSKHPSDVARPLSRAPPVTLPDELASMPTLRSLRAEGNPLQSVPPSLVQLMSESAKAAAAEAT